MKFKSIVATATEVKEYVEKHNKLPSKANGLSKAKYSYIFVKSVLNPNREIAELSYADAPNPSGDSIDKKYTKSEYTVIARDVNSFVTSNKRLPNYDLFKNVKVNVQDIVYSFAKIITFYGENKRLPATCKFDSSLFKTKVNAKTITPNETYNYFVKKTGKRFTTIDDLLAYVKAHGTYLYYFNGHKTNKEVTDSMAANCTDWLQWLINMAEAMGYSWKCIHVQCKSGDGHVRGQFKHSKHTGGNWINRDPAAVAKGNSVTSIWCSNGTLIDTNPDWFLETLRK